LNLVNKSKEDHEAVIIRTRPWTTSNHPNKTTLWPCYMNRDTSI